MMSDEQVEAMMRWQRHAGMWCVSQAICLQQMAEEEGLEGRLSADAALTQAIELFRIAREEEINNA